MIHNLKIRECFADPVLSGEKSFEVRYNGDRGFQKGDIVNFRVIDESGHRVAHEVNSVSFTITYVLSGFGLEHDHVAFGIKKLDCQIGGW